MLLVIFFTHSSSIAMSVFYDHAESVTIEHPAKKGHFSPVPTLKELACKKIVQVACQHSDTFVKHPYCLTHYFKKPLACVPFDYQKPIVKKLLSEETQDIGDGLSIEQALLLRHLIRHTTPFVYPLPYKSHGLKYFSGPHFDRKITNLCYDMAEKNFFEIPPRCDARIFQETQDAVEELALADLSSFNPMTTEQATYANIKCAVTKQSMINYLVSQAKLLPFLYNYCQLPVDRVYLTPTCTTKSKNSWAILYMLDEHHVVIRDATPAPNCQIDYSLWQNNPMPQRLLNFKNLIEYGGNPEKFAISKDGHYLLHTTESAHANIWDIAHEKKTAHVKSSLAGCFLPTNKHVVILSDINHFCKTITIADCATGLSIVKINIPCDCNNVAIWGDKLVIFRNKSLPLIYSLHLLSTVTYELNNLNVHQALCLARSCTILQCTKKLDLATADPQAWLTIESIISQAPHVYSLLLFKNAKSIRLPWGNLCEHCLSNLIKDRCAVCQGTQQDQALFDQNPIDMHNRMRLQQAILGQELLIKKDYDPDETFFSDYPIL